MTVMLGYSSMGLIHQKWWSDRSPWLVVSDPKITSVNVGNSSGLLYVMMNEKMHFHFGTGCFAWPVWQYLFHAKFASSWV